MNRAESKCEQRAETENEMLHIRLPPTDQGGRLDADVDLFVVAATEFPNGGHDASPHRLMDLSLVTDEQGASNPVGQRHSIRFRIPAGECGASLGFRIGCALDEGGHVVVKRFQ